MSPVLSSRGAVNDNRLLDPVKPETRFSTITDLSAATAYRSETLAVTITPVFRLSRYTGSRKLDSDDVFLTLAGQRNAETQSYGLNFSFERSTTLTSEFADSGRVDSNGTRTSIDIAPFWSWQLTDKATLQVTSDISDTSFEQGTTGGSFSDFKNYSAGPELDYALTERTQLIASSQISRFETPADGGQTDGVSIRGGASHLWTETLKSTLLFGWNFADIAFSTPALAIVNGRIVVISVPQQAQTSGELINLSLEKSFERGTLAVNWDKLVSPSSEGSRQQREQVRGFASYQLTSRSSMIVDLTYSDQSQENQQNNSANTLARTQLYSETAWRYSYTKEVSFEVGYRNLYQFQDERSDAVDYNEVYVGLRFAAPQYLY